jgi:hypothetical protein
MKVIISDEADNDLLLIFSYPSSAKFTGGGDGRR